MLTSSSGASAFPLPAEEDGEVDPARRRTSRPALESVAGGTFQTTPGTAGPEEEVVVVGLGRGLKVGRRLRAGFLGEGGGGGSDEAVGGERWGWGSEENFAAMGQEGSRVVRQEEPGAGEA